MKRGTMGRPRQRLTRLLAMLPMLLLALLLAGNLNAGTKVKIKGSVEEVVNKVDGAFETLELDAADRQVDESWAQAVGKDEKGLRLKVAVKRIGVDECEVEISGDSPDDAAIEERFLRLMQSR